MLPLITYPLAAVGLVGVPILVAIYLLRNRFRRYPVSSLMLWLDPREAREGGARVRRLQTPLLFLLELIAILLLVLAAAEPRVRMTAGARPLVVVLDDSFSMQAGGDDSPRNQAVRALLEEVRKRPPYSVRFVLAGERPQTLGEPVRSAREVEEALQGWRCRAPASRLEEATTLAAELGGELALLLVLTDHEPPEKTVPEKGRLQWWSFGKSRGNFAIVSAARTAREGADRMMLEVANLSDRDGATTLTLQVGDEVLERSVLEIPARQTLRIPRKLEPDTPGVKATLADDALVIDNEVTLLPTGNRGVRVDVRVGPKEVREPLLKAVRAVRGATVTDTSPEVVFVDGKEDVEAEGAWLVRVLVEKEAVSYTGPFVLDRTHPLTEGLSLRGVIWGAGKSESLEGNPVIMAGNVVLLSDLELAGPEGAARHELRWRIRPDLSTLQESPDWPILVWNILSWRAAQTSGPSRSNVRLGETVTVTFPQPRDTAQLSPPGSPAPPRELPVKGRQVSVRADEVGVWGLKSGEFNYEFSAGALNRDESDLLDCRTGTWGDWLDETALRLEYRSISWAILLLLLGVVVLHLVLVARLSRKGVGL